MKLRPEASSSNLQPNSKILKVLAKPKSLKHPPFNNVVRSSTKGKVRNTKKLVAFGTDGDFTVRQTYFYT